MGQIGFFDIAKRYADLDAKNAPLVKIDEVVPWEALPATSRGGFLALYPCEGGREELSGVLGGSFDFASNSATRAVGASTFTINSALTANAASNCVQSAMISASLSASESLGSGGA
jgi:hypothetical protein